MNHQVSMGIAGMARMAKICARLAQENAEGRLAPVCDSDAERWGRSEITFDVPACESVKELMQRPEWDAIAVATPDFLHLDPVLGGGGAELIRAGGKATFHRSRRGTVNAGGGEEVFWNRRHSSRLSLECSVCARGPCSARDAGRTVAMNTRVDDRTFVPTRTLRWSQSTTSSRFLLGDEVNPACRYSAAPVAVYATGVKQKLLPVGIDAYDSPTLAPASRTTWFLG